MKRYSGGPGYGKYFTGKGAMVTIRSRDGSRRVSIKPAFDPMADTMTPPATCYCGGCTAARAIPMAA